MYNGLMALWSIAKLPFFPTSVNIGKLDYLNLSQTQQTWAGPDGEGGGGRASEPPPWKIISDYRFS